MRVPLNWLAEYVDLEPGATPESVQEALVKVGLEEEDVHTFDLTGPIVVGEVLEFTPEEQSNGKTINWCRVRVAADGEIAADGGDAIHGIVCGAHNFRVGDKVVVTLPGAVLPGNFVIAPRKTYGHVSEGMMASARELGLGDEHDGIIVLSKYGIDAPVGTPALPLLGLDDTAVEINVTPDRGYAFSVRGVAREYSHATGAAFRDPALAPAALEATGFSVEIRDDAPIRGVVGADAFTTRVVRGVDATRPTPPWLVARLSLAGVRSISLLVDITNYVMFELGQPIHGYDLDKVAGGLVVRRAEKGETLVTLDGTERKLHAEDLVIADDSGAIGLAGVMGGASTEISDTTTDVLIEAAHFSPVSIARTARRHKLPSEASKRFERGVDPRLGRAAAARVAELLVELAGGTIDSLGQTIAADETPEAILLPAGYVSGLIGTEYTVAEETSALEEIGAEVTVVEGGLSVVRPTWRSDITDPCDLAEEIARIIGYDRIPSRLPVAPPGRGLTRTQRARRRVAQTLAAAGSTEVQSYPFVSAETNNLFGTADAATGDVPAIKLANALDAREPFLRTSVLPGLIGVAKRNLARGLVDLSIYETGLVFRPEAGASLGYAGELPNGTVRPSEAELAALKAGIPPQPHHVGVLIVGNVTPKQPGQEAVPSGLADALDAVRQVALAAGVEIRVEQGSHQILHPGRTAALYVGETLVGYAGELLPSFAAESDLPRTVAVAEINLDAVLAGGTDIVEAQSIFTFMAATQDLSLTVPVEVPAAEVQAAVLEGAGELLEHIRLVDDYRGQGLAEGHKSLSFALRFRAADRTLTAAEASEAKLAGAALAGERFGAAIRD
ncbi:phenylalanyl-tRNA synthetase beta chain [Mycetocola sp. BIGb0189]|uniref:phenylalanine--tRNA ligase subunit beta n=1 Tax=Mycetocola sp. BIGb0189 TaxID=2940604 RepID=UPI00216754DA|nr:phenylalanine--tRNA ligase subunit beta [Mycetocola sp. BIGb0189]MCS4275122.1 phenylalanyl-tRNA synthetase beta chain [Mycetocola sp. BIGb0189]